MSIPCHIQLLMLSHDTKAPNHIAIAKCKILIILSYPFKIVIFGVSVVASINTSPPEA